jgi:5-methyltetrahydropteroyltriglutamate--homocysteine methyltransferase
MQRSSERILTTHTGSLPRPPELVTALYEREQSEGPDEATMRELVRQAVMEVVQKQVGAGVDVANDGEMGKISYATYVKDRLTGFDGVWKRPMPADLADYPEFARESMFTDSSVTRMRTAACTGPVTYRGLEGVQQDVETLKGAVAASPPTETFMSAASPGVISLFLQNQYYPTHEAYIGALADAMKQEYEAIHRAGFLLQVDCPDLGMGRHTLFAEADDATFLKNAELHVEALNHALANIPSDRLRLHLCWGNYEGPHHRDVPLKAILPIALKARADAISFEGANPRHGHEWSVFREVKLPEGKLLIPGVLDTTTNFIEHPELVAERIERFACVVGRENVIAGTDCGFGTAAGRRVVQRTIVWAKVQAMTDGARIASERLWKH